MKSSERLLPADRELMRLLSTGVMEVHSEAVRLRMGHALGLEKTIGKNTVQHSLRRLQGEELIVKVDYGKYRVQDDGFADWLRALELDR